MILRTHITFSWSFFFIFLAAVGVSANFWTLSAISLGAVLPDIDSPASRVGRLFPSVSRYLEKRWGHRTITHSWFTLLTVSIVFISFALLYDQVIFSWLYHPAEKQIALTQIAVALSVGLWSHSILDTFTVQGVKALYPLSNRRCVFPLDVQFPQSFRTITGSKLDKVLSWTFLIIAVLTLPMAAMGYQRLIRFIHRDITSAVNDYNEFIMTHRVIADIEAVNNLTRQTIKGEYPVIGVLDNETILFRKEGKLYTLGNSTKDMYIVENVVCRKDKPVRIDVKYVTLKDQLLSDIMYYFPQNAEENLVFGECVMKDPARISRSYDKFNPVTVDQSKVKLEYATSEDLSENGLLQLPVQSASLMIKSYITEAAFIDTNKVLLPGEYSDIKTDGYIFPVSGKFRTKPDVLVSVGDNVVENQTLIRDYDTSKISQLLYNIRLNEMKIQAVGDEYAHRKKMLIASLNSLILDSAAIYREYVHNVKWRKGEYISEMRLDKNHTRLDKIRLKIVKTTSELNLLENKNKTEIESKQNAILKAKDRINTLTRNITSPYEGKIHDIRYSFDKNSNHLITILIQKHPGH